GTGRRARGCRRRATAADRGRAGPADRAATAGDEQHDASQGRSASHEPPEHLPPACLLRNRRIQTIKRLLHFGFLLALCHQALGPSTRFAAIACVGAGPPRATRSPGATSFPI